MDHNESLSQEHRQQGGVLDEEEINLQVYRETCDIYVGGYRNQRVIELEKENMDGDFSNLQLGTFIAVASKHCPDRRQFWIARVEKIIAQSENEIPKVIEVLWYAAKKGRDSFKEKYVPNVLGSKKFKEK